MSGTIRGRIGIWFPGEGADGDTSVEAVIAQGVFTNLYEFFDAHPNATILATQFGSGGDENISSGTPGIGLFGEDPQHWMRNAFFLVRMEPTGSRSFPYYLLWQWADNDNFGDSPGNPASIDDDSNGRDLSIGVALAVGEGGDDPDFNPWTGSMNADGADTKGSTVWDAPAGTVKSGNTEPFGLADADTLDVVIDGGGTQTVTFNSAAFSDITNATAAEVAAEINTDITGGTAFPQPDGSVIIRTATRGAAGSVQVTGGTGNAAGKLDFPTTAASGGDRAHVYPRSANAGGVRSTNREDMIPFYNTNSSPNSRVNIFADDDSVWWTIDEFDNYSWDFVGYLGLYEPRQGMTPTFPIIALYATSFAWGDDQNGGVIHPTDTSQGVIAYTQRPLTPLILSGDRQPNRALTPVRWDVTPLALYANESPYFGYFGRIELIGETYSIAESSIDISGDYAVFGPPQWDNTKVAMPWAGTISPRRTAKRNRGTDVSR